MDGPRTKLTDKEVALCVEKEKNSKKKTTKTENERKRGKKKGKSAKTENCLSSSSFLPLAHNSVGWDPTHPSELFLGVRAKKKKKKKEEEEKKKKERAKEKKGSISTVHNVTRVLPKPCAGSGCFSSKHKYQQ